MNRECYHWDSDTVGLHPMLTPQSKARIPSENVLHISIIRVFPEKSILMSIIQCKKYISPRVTQPGGGGTFHRWMRSKIHAPNCGVARDYEQSREQA